MSIQALRRFLRGPKRLFSKAILPSGDESRLQILQRLSLVLLGLAVTAVLALALGYTFLAVPGSDEHCFTPIDLRPLEMANEFYARWSGRWLGILIYSALLGNIDMLSLDYPVVLLSSFAFWFGGFYLVSARLSRGWAQRTGWAMALLAVFWAGSPGQGQTFYWLAGSFFYALPFFLSVGCVALVARLRPRPIHFIAAASLALAAGLVHELAGIVLIVGLGGYAIWRRANQLPITGTLAVLATAVVGLSIVVLAPGSGARLETPEPQSSTMLAWYLVRPYRSWLATIADPRLIALTTLVLLLPRDRDRPAIPWWLAPALAVTTSVVAAGVTVVALQAELPERVLAYLHAVTLSAWFVAAWILRGRIAVNTAPASVAAVTLALLLVTAPVIGRLLQNLPETVRTWRQDNEARWNAIRAAGSDSHVAVPFFRSVAPLMADPVQPDPKHWSNLCVARYFGVRSIRRQD